MNEDFVPYELAVKLKEKGYPQHIADDAYIIDNEGEEEYDIGERLPIPLVPDYMDIVAAPTISQVLKWLRENHKLHISTKPYPCEDGLRWMYEVRKFSSVLVCVVVNKTGFHEPEQAAIARIEYCLVNLI
jgi:hypothetical protein